MSSFGREYNFSNSSADEDDNFLEDFRYYKHLLHREAQRTLDEIEEQVLPRKDKVKPKVVKEFPTKKLKFIRDMVTNDRLGYARYKESPSYFIFLNQMHNYLTKKDRLITLADVLGENPIAK